MAASYEMERIKAAQRPPDQGAQAFSVALDPAFFLAAHRWRIVSEAASRCAGVNRRRFFFAGWATSVEEATAEFRAVVWLQPRQPSGAAWWGYIVADALQIPTWTSK